MPMPDEIIGLLRSKVTFKWPDGHVTTYPARDLRLACRCASCIEEMSGKPLLDPATVPTTIRANSMELAGQYAVVIACSGGHTPTLSASGPQAERDPLSAGRAQVSRSPVPSEPTSAAPRGRGSGWSS